VEESATHFVREATIAGADLREIITLEPQGKVTFFQATGPREGAIINELFEDENGALQLRFYCYLGLRGISSPTARKSRPSRRSSTATRATRPRCCRRCGAPVSCSRRTRCAPDGSSGVAVSSAGRLPCGGIRRSALRA
jgi:hypothetical protein